MSGLDPALVVEAAEITIKHQLASTSLLQRRMDVRFSVASRLLDALAEVGVVTARDGLMRQVIVAPDDMAAAIARINTSGNGATS